MNTQNTQNPTPSHSTSWERFKCTMEFIAKYISPMEGEHFDNMTARLEEQKKDSKPIK